ncbi:MAG: FAD:protein FMN transferase [Planctomycetes bacterium]|nr:FAD:protein FMN transferase [Planctomycetota bacterium]
MGTSLTVEIRAHNRADAIAASEMAIRAVETTETRLSTWTADSELSGVNNGTPAAGLLAAELAAATEWSHLTAGAFQPRAGALIQAWDLRGSGRRPSPTEISTANADRSIWEEGGFGKGAGLDQAIQALAQTEIQSAVLNLGGQIAVLGATTTIQVSHPLHRDQVYANFAIEHGSVATSGNSERSLTVNGQPIGHLLDPRTGLPAPEFGSVTVWAPSALAADCLSTALFVMGPDVALEWAQHHPQIEVLVLITTTTGVQVRATPKLKQRLHLIPSHSS